MQRDIQEPDTEHDLFMVTPLPALYNYHIYGYKRIIIATRSAGSIQLNVPLLQICPKNNSGI